MTGTLWCRVSAPLVRAGINQLPHRSSIAQPAVDGSVNVHARGVPMQRARKSGAGRTPANVAPKDALPPEVKELWQRFVGPDGSSLTRQHAIYLYGILDHDHILGWAPHRLKKPPCYDEYVRYKREHPSKLIAMQVGDFFEFAGWDAVMAIQTNKLLGMGLRAPLLLACTPVYLTALQIRLGTIKPSEKGWNGTANQDAPVARHVLEAEGELVQPRSGFPLRFSRWQIANLCRNGYEVAIVLQQPVVDKNRASRVDRYVAQICTPHSPYYHGDTSADSEDGVEEAPAWGIAPSVEMPGRWTVHMWQRETLTRTSTQLHSYEELIDHLEAARARPEWLSLPIYFHTASSAHEGAMAKGDCRVSLDALQEQEGKAKEWLRSRFELAPRVVNSMNASDEAAFVEAVQSSHLFPPNTSAAGQQAPPQIWSTARSGDAGSPLFLHESTARALGIKPGATPDIVAEALGEKPLRAHLRRVRGLLMRPPPREVALDIAATVRALLEAHVVPPFLKPRNMSAAWSHLQACRASTADLQALYASATATSTALQQPAAASIMDPLLKVASWSRGGDVPLTRSQLQVGCDRVIGILQPVLPKFEVASADATQDVDQEVEKLKKELAQHGLVVEEHNNLDLKALASFFVYAYPVPETCEQRKLHDVVALQALPDAHSCSQQLSKKRHTLLRVIVHSVKSAGRGYELSKGEEEGSAVAELQSITNPRTASMMIKIVADNSKERESIGLAGKWVRESASWRKHNTAETWLPVFTEESKKKLWVSSDLLSALEEYREVVQDMHEEATRVLGEATATLYDGGQNMSTLLAAQEVNEWGDTLAQVAECAARRQWTLPHLTGPEGSLQLKGVWPYWLPRPEHGPSNRNIADDLDDSEDESCNEDEPLISSDSFSAGEAVANDLELGQRMMVLTGANMSGKSTLMRAIMATALLGSAGLPVPCMDATIPEFKSFFYRCFDGDNPRAGLSGHAYECKQMKTLYDIVGPFQESEAKHLICIDELGKGTDDSSATALCCAAMQKFDQSNIVGIFATHQHDMVDDRLRFLEEMQRAYCCHMEVVEGAGKDTAGMPSWLPWYRPTFRMQPGGNYDSLALQVAWQEGMPPDVVYEAKQLLEQLR